MCVPQCRPHVPKQRGERMPPARQHAPNALPFGVLSLSTSQGDKCFDQARPTRQAGAWAGCICVCHRVTCCFGEITVYNRFYGPHSGAMFASNGLSQTSGSWVFWSAPVTFMMDSEVYGRSVPGLLVGCRMNMHRSPPSVFLTGL